MLSAQFGLRSEPRDWYRDAKSVPYDRKVIEFSPGTDGGLLYCTISGSCTIIEKFISRKFEAFKVFSQ